MDEEKDKIVTELSKRNAETFNQVVREQNKKLEEQEIRINQLSNSVSSLMQKVIDLERLILAQKMSSYGTGPTSV